MKQFYETCFLADISSIDCIDWHLIKTSTDLDSAVENRTNTLSLIIEKHAPMPQCRVSERYWSWMTSKLKANIKSRNKLKKSAIKNVCSPTTRTPTKETRSTI